MITPLTGRLQYPIWEKALRSCGIAETDIPHIVDKMKKPTLVGMKILSKVCWVMLFLDELPIALT